MLFSSIRATLALGLFSMATALPLLDNGVSEANSSPLVARQCQGTAGKRTALEGDGAPFQQAKFVQLTTTNTCVGDEGDTCSISYGRGETVSIGFTSEVAPFSWISGGFSVEQSFTFNEEAVCGGTPGDTVCVWQRVQHTGYTVRNYGRYTSCLQDISEPFVVRSPNANQDTYECRQNEACGSRGQEYWE